MQKKPESFFSGYWLEIIWVIGFGVVGRLIPHLPNMTPIMGLCLFASANLPRFVAVGLMFFALLFSDMLLALIFGYPLAGYFTLFTYTGTVMAVLVSSKVKCSRGISSFYVLGASSCFWLWTNFGVWLTSGLYPKTLGGLSSCYYLALPFLRNALIGDLIWSYLIFGCFCVFLREKICCSCKR